MLVDYNGHGKMSSGIYVIENLVDGKKYVGRTKCFYKRYQQYVHDFRNQKASRCNEYMLRACIKHGAGNFIFRVFEVCALEDLVQREYELILELGTLDKNVGYNLRNDKIGVGMITHELTSLKISNRLKKEWASGVRAKHSEKMTKHTFVIYDPDGDEVTTLSLKELQESLYSRATSRISIKGVRWVSLGNSGWVEKVPVDEYIESRKETSKPEGILW